MNFKIISGIITAVVVIFIFALFFWSDLINAMLPEDSRPGKIVFSVDKISSENFETIAEEVSQEYEMDFVHIEQFRENGILAYEGPKTCLNLPRRNNHYR